MLDKQRRWSNIILFLCIMLSIWIMNITNIKLFNTSYFTQQFILAFCISLQINYLSNFKGNSMYFDTYQMHFWKHNWLKSVKLVQRSILDIQKDIRFSNVDIQCSASTTFSATLKKANVELECWYSKTFGAKLEKLANVELECLAGTTFNTTLKNANVELELEKRMACWMSNVDLCAVLKFRPFYLYLFIKEQSTFWIKITDKI